MVVLSFMADISQQQLQNLCHRETLTVVAQLPCTADARTTAACSVLSTIVVQASEDAGPRKKKKAKPDKQADGTGSRPQRSKRGQHEQADEQQRQPQEFVEVNEDEIVETDADRNFIDDDGRFVHTNAASVLVQLAKASQLSCTVVT